MKDNRLDFYKDFSITLFHWYSHNQRDLPWRHTQDPYKVWLSEIILQQTRVDQGMPYYYNFIESYPTVSSLANAHLDDVYKLWEGLGYYSRARNLHKAAKIVVEQFNGVFPNSYNGLITLPGIGDYTASAISSFCFNEVRPVLDGNVFRVISRLFGIKEPINKPASRKIFKDILNELIDKHSPASFNQAIMEFGAVHCKPKQPKCDECIFQEKCFAFSMNKQSDYPVKVKPKKSITRFFNYLIVGEGDDIWIKKRSNSGIWSNLHEFPLIEGQDIFNTELIDETVKIIKVSKATKHILSHQNIYAKFYRVKDVDASFLEGCIKVKKSSLPDYAMHRLMTRFLEEEQSFM